MSFLLRLVLAGGVLSALALLVLLVWSTGNASRIAQYHDLLIYLNGTLAFALFVWVVTLSVRLVRQLRRGLFGARLTARFALAFATDWRLAWGADLHLIHAVYGAID